MRVYIVCVYYVCVYMEWVSVALYELPIGISHILLTY